MLKNIRNKRKSLFSTLLISYLLMLIIPTVIGTISYMRAAHVVKKEMESYNMAMLQQAQRVLDERLMSIDQLTLDIALDPRIRSFLYVKRPMSSTDLYNMSKVVAEMDKYKNVNNFIDEVYIYFKNSDIIINNNAKYEPSLFYQEIVPYSQWQFDEWKSLLMQSHYKTYKPLQSLALKIGGKEVITYLQSLPLDDKKNPMATLVISIEKTKIESLLKDISILDKGAVYIIDSNDQILMNIGDKRLLKPVKYKDLTFTKDYFYDNIGGQEAIISYVSSSFNDWKYVSVVPTAVFMDDVKHIKTLTIVIVAIELIIGLALAFPLARNNYIPIKRLVDKLKEKIRPDDALFTETNEIEFIDGVTAATIRENERIKEAMQRQQGMLKSNLMMQLIKGNVDDIHKFSTSLEDMDLSFDYPYFCVLLIDIDDCSKFVKDDSLQEKSLLKFVIANVAEELGNKNHKAYIVDIDWDQIALIVNLKNPSNGYKGEMYTIAQQLQQFMAKEYSTFLSIGIGSVHKDLRGINISYKEAASALEYRMVKGQNSIIISEDITAADQKYEYPIEMEMQLINAIRAGNTNSVKELLKKIFQKNFKQRELPLELARCLFFDIMSTAIKVLDDLGADRNEIFGQNYQPLKQLVSCQTADDMYKTLEIIYERICSYISEQKSHNAELKERILSYMEKHYEDSTLSLTSIADAMGINPTYLSHFFKKQMGENFIDYLCKLRIKKVKELLKDPNLTLEDVAERIGYSNSGVLIRTFKKYEGVTPGKYRSELLRS